MRAALLSLTLLSACSDGTSHVLVSLSAGSPVRAIDHFDVVVENAGQVAIPFQVTPASRPYDLTDHFTFLLAFDAERRGGLTLTVEATGASGVIARGTGTGSLLPGDTSEVQVLLGAAPADLGMNDSTVPDLSSADQTADQMPSPDLLPADASTVAPTFTITTKGINGQAYAVGVADFDGDTLLDFVVGQEGNPGTTGVTLFLGDGSGGFVPQPVISTGAIPVSLAVGRFDGDTLPDIALTGPGKIQVYTNGHATDSGLDFVIAGSIIADTPTNVVAGDWDGDGRTDVAFNGSNNNLTVAHGDGTGKLDRPQVASYGNQVPRLLTASINHKTDSLDDLVMLDNCQAQVFINTSASKLTFPTAFTPSPYEADRAPQSAAAGDLDGDGKLDLVVGSYGLGGCAVDFGTGTGDNLTVLLGTGVGTFQPGGRFATGDGPLAVELADLNGDGRLDAVVANSSAGTVVVLVGRGDGTFAAPITIGSSLYQPRRLAIGDFDKNGRPDIVLASLQSSVTVFKNITP